MNQMEFNILRRAQDNTKMGNQLTLFFKDKGIDIKQVKANPEYYEELIKQYSKSCINQGLFEESKERREQEFRRLCEFHRRNEAELVEKFYKFTKDSIQEANEEQPIE